MTKKPTIPCSACGKLLWKAQKSSTPGVMTCLDCRRARPGVKGQLATCQGCAKSFMVRMSRQRFCSQACANKNKGRVAGSGPCADCGTATTRNSSRIGRLCDSCRAMRRRSHYVNKNHRRRSEGRLWGDVTNAYEANLRSRARSCPLCRCRLTDRPTLPNSKELDHILPIVAGGTHTIGNVRIICRACNVRRPHDGSDYQGTLTLWAEDPDIARGFWLARHAPKPSSVCKSRQRPRCACGEALRDGRCPRCRARRAAEMRAAGDGWQTIADSLGYANTSGPYLAVQAYKSRRAA